MFNFLKSLDRRQVGGRGEEAKEAPKAAEKVTKCEGKNKQVLSSAQTKYVAAAWIMARQLEHILANSTGLTRLENLNIN